jgi:nucleoside-diphosphate-sugar epimerase
MRILVIGGTGFLGVKVIRRLLERGEQVLCFDVVTSSPCLADLAPEIRFLQGDITEIEEIVAAIRDHRVDRIIHLAYLKTAEAEIQLQKAMRLNVLGTTNVFEAARITGVRRVAYVSSVGFYGLQASFGERPVTEEDRGFPVTVYGYTKGLNDHLATRYAELYNLEPVCLRLAFAFGHGRVGAVNAWPSTFASNPAIGKPASLPRSAQRKYCVIYVDDAAAILCDLALRERLEHRVYLSGGYTVSVAQLAEMVQEFIPDARFTYDGKEGDHSYVYLLDSTRLRQELSVSLPPLRRRVLDHINEARRCAGLSDLGGGETGATATSGA